MAKAFGCRRFHSRLQYSYVDLETFSFCSHSNGVVTSSSANPYSLLIIKNEIWILKLSPGKTASTIKVELISGQLSDSPNDEAVSYTWADDYGDYRRS